ncbi:hypothetical protein [Pseudomonas sp. 2835]|uniref:hypothetical protein n=1 Tax=Pseudomonas sp. 2835 TaxID=3156451 RepID=UPI003D24497C
MGNIITDQSEALRESHDYLMFGSPKDRLDFYRKEIHYETTMLSSRTNAYLTSQSFLVIAYGSSMSNINPEWGKVFTLVVPMLMAILGLISSLHAWPGMKAAYEIIDHWYFKQSHLLQSELSMGHVFDESPLFTKSESTQSGYRKGLQFSMRTPWIFSGFWLLLGVFTVYVQFA